ncbi:type II toxin-antitoxin system VapC family toxin [Candidatus Woesearchaeota archaeon]|nr:type II toxin-antitoxin system VapC family toxin [Candidatus Woesearchaeota archaeon]
MRILLDTNVLIELERRNKEAAELLAELSASGEELLVSVVVVSELLTGPYLTGQERALASAKRLLSQFNVVELNQPITETIAQYMAYLASKGTPLEYQDVAIAATFAVTKSDFLITQNKKHFEAIPEVGNKARTVSEFRKIYK